MGSITAVRIGLAIDEAEVQMNQSPQKIGLGDIVADSRGLLRKTVRHGRSVLDNLIGIGNDLISVLPDISHCRSFLILVRNEVELLPPLGRCCLKTDQVAGHFRIQDHIVVIELVRKPINTVHRSI